jgi:hypothetical protein
MKLPRKTKKLITEIADHRWPRRGSRLQRRLQRFCRRAIACLDRLPVLELVPRR